MLSFSLLFCRSATVYIAALLTWAGDFSSDPLSTSIPEMSIALTPSKPAINTHNKLATTKWQIVEPISSQEPSSFTTQK